MEAIPDQMLLKLPFMASNPKKSDSQRPYPLLLSKSFSRAEQGSPGHSTRNQRANTVQSAVIPESTKSSIADKRKSRNDLEKAQTPTDIFEKSPDGEEVTGKLPIDFDQLPIELVSLTDRWVVLMII
jgi:hypothetical protein